MSMQQPLSCVECAKAGELTVAKFIQHGTSYCYKHLRALFGLDDKLGNGKVAS